MNRLTKTQSAIIGAYTGTLCGNMEDMTAYIETILDRPVFTHELASKEVWEEIKEESREDFLDLCYMEEENG